MIYGAFASAKAYYASPLKDFGNYIANSAEGYMILESFLFTIAAFWILIYVVPVEYAAHNKTLKNCVDNVYYYKKYQYKLELYNALIINYDKLSRKKHKTLFNTAFGLQNSKQEPDIETEKGEFESVLITDTQSHKELLLSAIKNNDDQLAAILCQSFYEFEDNGKRIYADEEISLEIGKHRKKLKKTNLKYFGYGLKSFISYYIISYAAIIALHGLMIYGIFASFKAYDASPLIHHDGHHDRHSAEGYILLSSLLGVVALFWIGMYFAPVEYARHNKTLTLKNCQGNEANYEKIVKNVEEPNCVVSSLRSTLV